MDDIDKIDKGEIYLAFNKSTDKGYVGQARKYITQNKQKWGAMSRWIRHGQEANYTGKRSGKNTLINEAIRQHGLDSFQITVLCDCNINEMDEKEAYYIKHLNTLEPNGYNMTSGGRSGKHSEMANKKKQVRRKSYSEEAKQNMKNGQVGKRYPAKLKVDSGGNKLPKYVSEINSNGVIIGYDIIFPMGITSNDDIKIQFKGDKSLEMTIKKVEELQTEYNIKLNEYRSSFKKNGIETNVNFEILPQNIFSIQKDGRICGYYVDELKDYRGNSIPRRNFVANQNNYNYEHALKFIRLVEKFNKDKKTCDDWENVELPKNEKPKDLPNHIRHTYFKGVVTGYRVDYFVKYKDGKQVVESKCFTKKTISMHDKLENAKKFVMQMEEKYAADKSALNSELEKSDTR
jgi:hypothetical protein